MSRFGDRSLLKRPSYLGRLPPATSWPVRRGIFPCTSVAQCREIPATGSRYRCGVFEKRENEAAWDSRRKSNVPHLRQVGRWAGGGPAILQARFSILEGAHMLAFVPLRPAKDIGISFTVVLKRGSRSVRYTSPHALASPVTLDRKLITNSYRRVLYFTEPLAHVDFFDARALKADSRSQSLTLLLPVRVSLCFDDLQVFPRVFCVVLFPLVSFSVYYRCTSRYHI